MRCVACNRDMKASNGDEYWRTVKVGKKTVRVLEDMCKKCRTHIHNYERVMTWKEYDSELDFLEENDDILSGSETRHVEGRRPSYGNPDEL